MRFKLLTSLPSATETSEGTVKVKTAYAAETAPHTVPTMGKLLQEISSGIDKKFDAPTIKWGSQADSVSIGRGAKTSGFYCFSLYGNAAKNHSVAIGTGSQAMGENSIAIGANAKATKPKEGVLGVGSGSTGTDTWIVPGSFSVSGTKNFEIPHPNPKKTETHMLRHGAVETNSQGDNLYRYKIEAKEDGEIVVIDLPDYFVHLNKNIQIWAVGSDHFGRAYGIYKPDEEIVEVKCETRGEYNVQIIGTRNDNHNSVQSWSDKGVEKLKDTGWTFAEDLEIKEAEDREGDI